MSYVVVTSLGGPAMTRQERRFKERKLRKIKIVPTDFKLTAATGLGTVLEIFDQSGLAKEFKRCLPERISHRSAGSYFLALMVIAGHIHGVDALSDLAEVRGDPYVQSLFHDEVAAVRTIGDFLRDFEPEHIDRLRDFLNRMSRTLFASLQNSLDPEHRPNKLIIDMDSTYHVHYGEQIEGVAWNYKKEWSLESQVAFNSLGFCHGVQLRPGNTKSGTNAAEAMERIFSDGQTQIERRRRGLIYFRADSAYCSQEPIKVCLKQGALFTLTAHDGTTGWKSRLESEGVDWQPWVYTPAEIEKAKRMQRELPKVEVGRIHWSPSWSEEKLLFPIVIKRTWQPYREEKKGQESIFAPDTVSQMGEWEHYAVVTNFNLADWSLQGVMEHHAKRGNAENFMKEEKYNFNLSGFPCQKLLANHAWMLLAQVAHNMIRWIALMDAPDRPHYSKKIRSKYIFIAGRVVSHAKTLTLRVMRSAWERGLKNLKEGWQFPETMSAHALAPG
jgi:hypothetical protein